MLQHSNRVKRRSAPPAPARRSSLPNPPPARRCGLSRPPRVRERRPREPEDRQHAEAAGYANRAVRIGQPDRADAALSPLSEGPCGERSGERNSQEGERPRTLVQKDRVLSRRANMLGKQSAPAKQGPGPLPRFAGRPGSNRAAPVREVGRRPPAGARNPIHEVVSLMTLAGDPDSQTPPLRVGIGGPVGSGKTALVEAATFSPELADLTMTAPSIESRRDAQHGHCARHAGT
jgi:hypothetical protein